MKDTPSSYYDQLQSSLNAYLVPPKKTVDQSTNGAVSEPEPEKRRWTDLKLPGSLEVDGFEHRKPSNCCNKIRDDMVTCFKMSPCFKAGSPFESCMQSYDKDWVTDDCLQLRIGYAQCRRDLLNRQRIWQRGNRAAS